MEQITADSRKQFVAEVEDAKSPVDSEVAHYAPVTEEEKALDRRVNLKLDFTLILFLAVGFIVRRLLSVHTQTYTERERDGHADI